MRVRISEDYNIQQAFHELNEAVAVATRPAEKLSYKGFEDFFDQVYCSITHGEDRLADRPLLGDLGKFNAKYPDDAVSVSYNDNNTVNINVVAPHEAIGNAVAVAEIYGLRYKVKPFGKDRSRVSIEVPEDLPVDRDLLRYVDVDKKIKDISKFFRVSDKSKERVLAGVVEKRLSEDVASSMPVTILPHDEVYSFIENIPVATHDRGPRFFSVGYMKELGAEIPSKFRGGRGSDDNPKVRIFKCSEMTVYTGADYENLKATRAYRKETGKERSGEKTGFRFDGDTSIANKIGISARGEEQLQCYIRKGTKPRVKYFISLNDEDLREAPREEVAQYLTPGHANKILGNVEATDGPDGANIVRLKLSGIYRIGNLGQSIM